MSSIQRSVKKKIRLSAAFLPYLYAPPASNCFLLPFYTARVVVGEHSLSFFPPSALIHCHLLTSIPAATTQPFIYSPLFQPLKRSGAL